MPGLSAAAHTAFEDILKRGEAKCQEASTAEACHSVLPLTDADEAKIDQELEAFKAPDPTTCESPSVSASVQISLHFSVIQIAVIAFAMVGQTVRFG